MKVLIADDERHVIEAVELLIDWKKYGFDCILTAESVPEACDILEQEEVELAVVDVVLGEQLGIEIMKRIQSQQMKTKTIVISGHDDYQYTRAMFVLGALDYLLKPLIPAELEKAVVKAAEMLRKETVHSDASFGVDRQIKHLFPDHQHSLFRKLFQPELRDVALSELRTINSRAAESKECVVLYGSGLFLPIYSQDYVIALSGFLNKLQDVLESERCGTLFQRSHPDPDIVILVYDRLPKTMAMIEERVQSFVYETDALFRLGCSRPCAFADGIDAAYDMAAAAYDALDMRSQKPVRYYETGMKSLQPVRDKNQRKIFLPLLTGDRAAFEGALEEWMQAVWQRLPDTRGGVRCLWESFLLMYEQAKAESGIETEKASQRNLAELCGESMAVTIKRIGDEMNRRLWELWELRSEKPASGWERDVAHYLELNYSQRFYQQEIADRFHLNKDYMSRRFHEVYGVGMVTYLNHVRIQKAQVLLTETSLQIQEIADSVGFFDVKYFSQQFKKTVGVTPSKWRATAEKTLNERNKRQ